MNRYVEIEATDRAANDIRLPKREKGNGVERIIAWMRIYEEHYHAILQEAFAAGDKVLVME